MSKTNPETTVAKKLHEKIEKLIDQTLSEKNDIINKAILEYKLKNSLSNQDLKKNGRHDIYLNKSLEEFYYKDDLIISIKLEIGDLHAKY